MDLYIERDGVADTIPNNLHRVLDECGPKDILLICGSLYIMNEVRYAMGIREPQDVIYGYHCRDHGPESVAAGKAQYLYPHEKPVEWN